MIISIDTETQGLDATRFIMGCICYENLKTETFRNKKVMWNRILELAEKQRKQGKCLIVYAHNMQYDHIAIRPLPEHPHTNQYSQNPYIVDLIDDTGRIYCKFTSTTSLWRGSLATLGEAMGHPKTQTPEWLKKDKHKPEFWELATAEQYMVQDAKIVMHFLHLLRKLLKEHNMRPRWILTASQIGILGLLKKAKPSNALFIDLQYKKLWDCHNKDLHKEAIRGGRVQCFHTGAYKNLSSIDFRSHYPYHLATMRYPNLRSEQYIEEPREGILDDIGISCVEIITAKHTYGVLPVRQGQHNVYPHKKGQLLVGTWAHQEIKAAMQRGYKLQRIKWSVTYTEAENPFTDAIKEVYKLKKKAPTPMHRWLYKIFMNGGIGKFAQHRPRYTKEWRDEADTDEMMQKGYDCVQSQGMWNLWQKYEGVDYPRFFAPILNILVTADARIRLLEHMEKIPINHIYYVDTDGIIAHQDAIKAAKFKYSEDLGGLSTEKEGVEGLFWGPKAYLVGHDIKLSGVSKMFVNEEAFRAGKVTYKQMVTQKNTWDKELIGTFRTITRNLEDTNKEITRIEQTAFRQPVLIDERIETWTGNPPSKQPSFSSSP